MKNKYDVIIIGSGIAGLVSGLYLVKNGLKVLKLEQHNIPGGYCGSFSRKGYKFDSCIHFLKISKKHKSVLNDIIEDFGLEKRMQFIPVDPSDLIITPAGEFYVSSSVEKTVENLSELFPDEAANIGKFFNFLNDDNYFNVYSKTRGKTLDHLFQSFFKNRGLIGIFNCLLMNIGLPINGVSAEKAFFFFREFFYNESFYPSGGMQNFSDLLEEIYLENDGKSIFSAKVNEINLKNGKCAGVTASGEEYYSDYIISTADHMGTFCDLIGIDKLPGKFTGGMDSLKPSMSAFVAYLGFTNKAEFNYPATNSIWYFPTDSFARVYDSINNGEVSDDNDYLICSFPSSFGNNMAPNSGYTSAVFSGAPYVEGEFWNDNKYRQGKLVVERMKNIVPNIEECIDVSSFATPLTFERYTSNFKGACYGLASLPEQMNSRVMPQKTCIPGLFMAGHWVTHGIGQGGVSMAAFSGIQVSKKIIKLMEKIRS